MCDAIADDREELYVPPIDVGLHLYQSLSKYVIMYPWILKKEDNLSKIYAEKNRLPGLSWTS